MTKGIYQVLCSQAESTHHARGQNLEHGNILKTRDDLLKLRGTR